MAKYFKIIAVVFFSLLISKNAFSEACWMVGCKGSTGFIRIPAGQIEREKSNIVIINGGKYVIDDSTLLFKTPGLPSVNSVVKVNTSTSISSEWNGNVRKINYERAKEIVKHNKLESKDYDLDKNTMTAKLRSYEGWGGTIGKGSQIEIIKYIPMQGKDGEVLLAFIYILTDEND